MLSNQSELFSLLIYIRSQTTWTGRQSHCADGKEPLVQSRIQLKKRQRFTSHLDEDCIFESNSEGKQGSVALLIRFPGMPTMLAQSLSLHLSNIFLSRKEEVCRRVLSVRVQPLPVPQTSQHAPLQLMVGGVRCIQWDAACGSTASCTL